MALRPRTTLLSSGVFLLLTLLLITDSFSQAKDEYVYAEKDYNEWVSREISDAVTRSDEFSLFLDEFSFASSKKGNFMAEVETKLFEINPDTRSRDMRVVNTIINELIKIDDPNQGFQKGAKNILFNEDLENVYQITLKLTLTRLSVEQEKEFKRIFADLTTSIPMPPFVKKVLNVDENTVAENKDKIEFDATFYIPLNFLEYNKLEPSVPLFNENRAVVLAIKNSILPETTDTNLKNWFKNKINGIANFFAGETLIKDNNTVSAVARLHVSTSTNFSLPSGIKQLMHRLNDAVYKANSDAISKLCAEIEKTADNFKSEKYISQRTYDNILYYTTLAEVFRVYIINKNKKPADQDNRSVLMQFTQWHSRADQYYTNWKFTKIKIKDLYDDEEREFQDPEKRGKTKKEYIPRMATIILPYSVDNDFIVAASKWQITLHKFSKDIFGLNADLLNEIDGITVVHK